jgi:energy-coupling factor transporter ATP-binding protein EcfA2
MVDPEVKKLHLLARVVQVFTPSAPVDDLALFAGRYDQLVAVLGAYAQRGQHAVIYGERGVGKTSLANIIDQASAKARGAAIRVARLNCGAQDNYSSLWLRALKKLGHDGLEEHEITVSLVVDLLEREEGAPLIILDEFDRLDNPEAVSMLADTIKTLSDQMIKATVVVVGVGDTVTDLVADHRSVERALVQIQMPRMSRSELASAVDKGLQRLNMRIADTAKVRITELSEGLPSVTHLLAQHAALTAAQNDRLEISDSDVEKATKLAVNKAQHSILDDYARATRSPRQDNLFEEVLLACALATKNELGWFTPVSVCAPIAKILGRSLKVGQFVRHLNEFVSADHAKILEKDGAPRKFVYRFTSPLMQAFVILRGLADGRIDEASLRRLRPPMPELLDGSAGIDDDDASRDGAQ